MGRTNHKLDLLGEGKSRTLHTGEQPASNVGKVGKHFRNLVPFLNRNHQALHLPAIHRYLRAEPE